MRTGSVALVLFAVAGMIWGGCGDDGTCPDLNPSSLQFLDHTDLGCVASRGGSLDCFEGATLTQIEAQGDTLVFWIRFEANCCPEFTETVSYDAGDLHIAVVDSLYACRCICPFENPFRFLRDGSGEVHLLFESLATRGGDICVSGLDTTVTVP